MGNKCCELDDLLRSSTYDIIAISESWLNATITDAMICGGGLYSVYRRDRPTLGGGVAILVRSSFRVTQVVERVGEIIAVDLLGPNPCRLVCCYRPPHYDPIYATALCESLSYMCDVGHPVVVVGDFNLPDFDFPNFVCPDSVIYTPFMQCFVETGLVQLIQTPTRGNNILDLLLVTEQLSVTEVCVDAPFSSSDHSVIMFNLCSPDYIPRDDADGYYDFKRTAFEPFALFLSGVQWPDLFSNCVTVDDFWMVFVEVLQEGIHQYVPYKTVSCKPRHPYYVRKLQQKKRRLWRRRHTAGGFEAYRKCTNDVSKAIYRAACASERRILNNGDPNALFKYVNAKRNYRSGVAPLLYEGVSAVDDHTKANVLSHTYKGFCTEDDGSLPGFVSRVPPDVQCSNVLFSEVCVLNVLKRLKPRTSRTPDGIPALLYVKLAHCLARPLCSIFEVSFRSHSLPADWLKAHVIPIFKKGDPSDPSNYRPVSLTSVACKLMEMCVNDVLMQYLSVYNLISEAQHGFLKKHSSSTQLLECIRDWSTLISAKKSIDVVYLDFAKAFNSVSHPKLLHKLRGYGITGDLLLWITAFLSDRLESVVVGNSISEYCHVTSGTPQGSILGPCLFLLYVNDLPDLSTVSCKMYADDVKLYCSSDEQAGMQESLDRILLWSHVWQMSLSVPKCVVLHFWATNPKHMYSLSGIDLVSQTNCRDLGVLMSADLKFSNHCREQVAKAFRVSNVIFRCFNTACAKSLIRAFKAYVRPLLEYCSCVWSPYLAKDIDSIECVQRYFTRRLIARCGLPPCAYVDRLILLQLEPLEVRRLRFDLVMLFKIVHESVDLVCSDFVTMDPNAVRLRGHHLRLLQQHSRTDFDKHVFNSRVIPIWNALDADIINTASVSCFSAKITTNFLMQFCSFDRNL